ncbi:hypothetical protein Bhyg_02871 [Pseudolycoriella hygida]|uniref:Uncharacterized protein n=1 Tax=Pseudolycoriella hygida TaxID=35572 RepID=A0A9Q0S870_9DIPT|nr:hypothetical protein Bhyg_02871 [Pseudolycoriella hygida]
MTTSTKRIMATKSSKKKPHSRKKPDLPPPHPPSNDSGRDSTVDETILDYAIIIDRKKKSLVWKYFGQLMNNATNNRVDEGYNFCNIYLQRAQTVLMMFD